MSSRPAASIMLMAFPEVQKPRAGPPAGARSWNSLIDAAAADKVRDVPPGWPLTPLLYYF